MIKKVNNEQKKAITHFNGPCMVLAGPGSGKTYVLTNRVLNLIEQYGISPSNILVITFTRAAANEMKDRFLKLIKEDELRIDEIPAFGTFHSVFYEILKNDFGYNSNSLIEDLDEKLLIVEVLGKYKKVNITNDLVIGILKDIKDYKLHIEKNENFIPKFISKDLFLKIYREYQNKLYNYKKLDFSDMINKCLELLVNDKEVLKYYQNKYKYVLIDEFQDINYSQYNLVKLICKSKNIFVVGDDDQSIYEFRGSRPSIMREFVNDYRKAKVIYMTRNYRSAKKIVKFSNIVIDNNEDRFKKELIPSRNDEGHITIKSFVDSTEENEYIIDNIKKYLTKGVKLSEMAVLYRTNLLANSIKKTLNKHNISYKIKNETQDPYNVFAVSDIISYLECSYDSEDIKKFVNIVNKPNRLVSRDLILSRFKSIDSIITNSKNNKLTYNKLIDLKKDLEFINNSLPALSIRYIRCKIGYNNYLYDYCQKNKLDYDSLDEVLNFLEEDAVSFKSNEEFVNFVKHNKNTQSVDYSIDSINLMTFHTCKGLEFKVVFIIDSNDGLIPHKKSIKDNGIEAERRLFYVGMTRAKDYLYILFTTRRFGKNFKASRFIIEAIGGQNG